MKRLLAILILAAMGGLLLFSQDVILVRRRAAASATPAYVTGSSAHLDGTGTDASTIVLKLEASVSAGAFVYGSVRYAGTMRTVTGVADDLGGNTYQSVSVQNTDGNATTVFIYSTLATGGTPTVTVTLSDVAAWRSMTIAAWTGVGALDVAGTATVGTTNSTSCAAAVATTNAADVLFSYVAAANNNLSVTSVASPFTARGVSNENADAESVVASVATYTATWTISSVISTCQTFAFKAQ